MFPSLYYDYDVGEWKVWDLVDLSVEQIELADIADRQNLTLGGAEGLKLLCQACKVPAELINAKLLPERIRCPECTMIGGADAIFDEARKYAILEKQRNNANVDQLGVHKENLLFSDIDDYLRDGCVPGVPAFIFR